MANATAVSARPRRALVIVRRYSKRSLTWKEQKSTIS